MHSTVGTAFLDRGARFVLAFALADGVEPVFEVFSHASSIDGEDDVSTDEDVTSTSDATASLFAVVVLASASMMAACFPSLP